jgi:hypothetical protein
MWNKMMVIQNVLVSLEISVIGLQISKTDFYTYIKGSQKPWSIKLWQQVFQMYLIYEWNVCYVKSSWILWILSEEFFMVSVYSDVLKH